MSNVTWTDETGARRETPPEYFFIRAAGEDAGSVWIRSPQTRQGWPMRPAEAEEIKVAETVIPGFKSARVAAAKGK